MSLSHVRFVLVRPRSSGNVGLAARTISRFGLGQLVLVKPSAFDPDQARWMAPGAHTIIDEMTFSPTVEEAVKGSGLVIGTSAKNRQITVPRWPLPDAAQTGATFPKSVSFVFGPEDTGLSNADLEWCHAVTHIPTLHESSLNLGQAITLCGAALFQSAENHSEAPMLRTQQANDAANAVESIDLRELALQRTMTLLQDCQYLQGKNALTVQGTLYRALQRMDPSSKEASIFLGMLAAVQYRISKANPQPLD